MNVQFPDQYDSYVDGKSLSSDETFTVYNPATNESLFEVAEAGPEGVDTALESANAAQDTWERIDPDERARILRDIADEIRTNADRLTKIETAEVGRPIEESAGIVEATAEYFEYYSGIVDKIEGETIPVPGNRHTYTVREPLGILALVVPWNAPSVLAARSIAPALACGNTIVAKPSPEAPASTIELGQIASEAGLPNGVLNVVPGDGANTGAALTESDQVGGIMFTGSRASGKQVLKAAADNLVPVGLELGGKNPSIVFPDADLEKVIDSMAVAYGNAGQVCFAPTRMYIHEDVYDEVIERFTECVENMSVGPGIDNPDVGPLITEEARDRVANYVDEAIEDGARLLAGGEVPNKVGNFYMPTILDRVDDDATISCEEVFGPVLTAYEFSSEEEVLQRANDVDYGLQAVVWTQTLDRAHRVAGSIEAGSILVNEYPAVFPQVPFGGYKDSGLGREKGTQAIDHYTQLKSINISLGDGPGTIFDK